MPGPSFAPGIPTISAGQLTLDALLAYPTLVQRALRSIPQQRFISDALLTMRVTPSGGAVQYGQNESIFAALTPEAIAAGEEYPQSTMAGPPYALAGVAKWGLDVMVTFEAIRRLNFDVIPRASTKAQNSVIQKVDTVALAAIAAAPINTLAATAAWSTGSADILLDLETAVGGIIDKQQGYMPNSLVVTTGRFVSITSNTKIQTALRRETLDNPIYQGLSGITSNGNDPAAAATGFRIAGLDVFAVPTANMPVGTTALVLDRNILGGMADEVPMAVRPILQDDLERWRIRASRITVPFVMEPAACTSITGT